jgi:hypothetical protein
LPPLSFPLAYIGRLSLVIDGKRGSELESGCFLFMDRVRWRGFGPAESRPAHTNG